MINSMNEKGVEKPDEQEELLKSWDWHVRRKLAWSPDTRENILETLARDSVQWVRGSGGQCQHLALNAGPAGSR